MPNFRILSRLLQLVLANLALRPQIAVFKRSVSKPLVEDSDRVSSINLRRTARIWRNLQQWSWPWSFSVTGTG